ncbi:hypothetical protein [Candidatus Aalborgicola defluviihabitans]|uniref:hypothetical protein n=1 Tax=Candidatus Aalborgicola defluviihabitans TaxID=3386187 RepID=UPI001E15C515|nr:hypothetical protein [Burkholderiales bacterium]MBK7313755.1 hypothetical protein [Burkholderiales bacterium]MBL0245498.1 hypothetical protein [Rhodoferax sp.]
MTTVQVELPDMLAQSAQAAGLLTPQALEAMLREQLKRQAGDALRAMWANAPAKELTPEMERMIDDEVKAVRAQQRKHALI